MDGFELIVFALSGFLTLRFLFKWYHATLFSWPFGRGKSKKIVLGLLPVAAFFIIMSTLETWASFDVVDDSFWIFFYIVLGFAWLWLGVLAMGAFFDLSWQDDILSMNNKAALYAFGGGFLGLTVIYAGANIGDGPGWWCVVFAGGRGLVAWIALAWAVNLFTNMFERVTVERDVFAGLRFGAFLLASGIILGRASAGDWTSFSMTVVEFLDGWPMLPLTLFAVMGEQLFFKERDAENDHAILSTVWGTALVVIAVACVIWLPNVIGK